ncbi:MAG: TspO/MBR family protein [Candidatus Acidiferrales bacterium]
MGIPTGESLGRLVASVAVCLGAAGLGAFMTTPALRPWYAGLNKPPWTPPNWLFGPVWTVLYLAMAVAAWLVWQRTGLRHRPMKVFVLQLALNVAWSGLFFGFRSPGAAFAEMIALWLAILATLIEFWKTMPAAGWLFIPYLIWVSFAAALNFSIWRLNA